MQEDQASRAAAATRQAALVVVRKTWIACHPGKRSFLGRCAKFVGVLCMLCLLQEAVADDSYLQLVPRDV